VASDGIWPTTIGVLWGIGAGVAAGFAAGSVSVTTSLTGGEDRSFIGDCADPQTENAKSRQNENTNSLFIWAKTTRRTISGFVFVQGVKNLLI
jgi:hypothetical protein